MIKRFISFFTAAAIAITTVFMFDVPNIVAQAVTASGDYFGNIHPRISSGTSKNVNHYIKCLKFPKQERVCCRIATDRKNYNGQKF